MTCKPVCLPVCVYVGSREHETGKGGWVQSDGMEGGRKGKERKWKGQKWDWDWGEGSVDLIHGLQIRGDVNILFYV